VVAGSRRSRPYPRAVIDPAGLADVLLRPPRLWAADEVLGRPSAVPASPGVYAWYFAPAPTGVPVNGCVRSGDHTLLYVGISPRSFVARTSSQNLRTRLRYHFRGHADGSTLRLTLGCVMADALRIRLRRASTGARLTFGEGEQALSAWMRACARVCWIQTPEPAALERYLLATVSLPLNLEGNAAHPFSARLSELRRSARADARTASQAWTPPVAQQPE